MRAHGGGGGGGGGDAAHGLGGAVGFYNAGARAGASQRHKHLQLIPTRALAALRAAASGGAPAQARARSL